MSNPTIKLDEYETEILAGYDSGEYRSVATKAELAKFTEAASVTAIKDRRVNIRLSASDLADIQVRALEEGLPYQTLIASVLHKYVTGKLAEKETVPASGLRRASQRLARLGGTQPQLEAPPRRRSKPVA